MTITFTSAVGSSCIPRLESDLGGSFTVTGEADTLSIEASVSEVNMCQQIALTGGVVSLIEVSSVPVLTLTTP